MHLRALVTGALLTASLAVAQDAPAKACDKQADCSASKAVVVSVETDETACKAVCEVVCKTSAAPVAVVATSDCTAPDCAATACALTVSAAPVALVATQDCEAECTAAAPIALFTAHGISLQDCAATECTAAAPVAFRAIQDAEVCTDAPVAIATLAGKGCGGTCSDCGAACGGAAPVAFSTIAMPTILSDGEEIGFDAIAVLQDAEVGKLEIPELSLNLDLDLSEILQDVDITSSGAIAIRLGEDGEYEVIDGFDVDGLVDLSTAFQDLEVELSPDVDFSELMALDLAIESDEIVAELAELQDLAIVEDFEVEEAGDERGYLGVQMNLEGGMNVTSVFPGSGAAKAGLKAGDRIVSVNGKSAEGEGITEYMQSLKAGDTAKIVYVRGDAKKNAKVRLMSLAAVQGGGEAVESEAMIEEVSDDLGGRLIRVEEGGAGDFRVLRQRVRDTVLDEIEEEIEEEETDVSFGFVIEGEGGDFHVRHDGDDHGGANVFFGDGGGDGGVFKVRVGAGDGDDEERVVRKRISLGGGGEGHGEHRIHFGGADGQHRTVEVHVEADAPSKGIFFSDDEGGHGVQRHGRVVIKRVEDGEESVEEYEWDGDMDDLPDHVRGMIKEHAGGRVRIHAEHGGGGENVIRQRIRRTDRPGGEGQDVFIRRAGGDDRVLRLHRHDGGGGHDHDVHEGHGHDGKGHSGGVWQLHDGAGGRAIFEFRGDGPNFLHKHDGKLHEAIVKRLHEHGLDEDVMKRVHVNIAERLRDRGGNRRMGDRIFLGRECARGFEWHADHDEDDDEGEELVEELHEEIEELHERIEKLEALVERLARRRR